MLPAVAVLAALGLGLFRARPGIEAGSPAPAFELSSLADPSRRVSLDELRGRPVVLNFWASWCTPCRDEAPTLAAAAAKAGERVVFVGVNILDGRQEARDFTEEFGIGYLNLRDPTGTTSRRYRVTGVPETIFLSADGRLAGRFIGDLSQAPLNDLVDDLVVLPPGGELVITGRGKSRPLP